MKKNKLMKLGVLLMLGVFLIGGAIPAMAAEGSANAAGDFGQRLGQRMQTMLTVVSDLTGLGVDQVRGERHDGKSFVQISEENGVDAATVTGKVLETNQARLESDLETGSISQEQYDTCVNQMNERVTERLERNTTGPNGQGGYGRVQDQGQKQGKGQGRGMMGQGGAGNGTCVNTDGAQ